MSGTREGCAPVRDRLIDLAYGEIEGAEADEVRAHVGVCAECRAELEGIMRVRSIVSASRSIDLPSALEARVMSEARDALAARSPAAAPAPEKGRAGGAGLRGWLAGLLVPSVMRPAIATAATVLLVAGVVWVVGVRDRGVVDRYTDRGDLPVTIPGIGAPPAPPAQEPVEPAGTAEAPAAPAQDMAQAVEKAPAGPIVDEGPATLQALAKKDVAAKADQPRDAKKAPAGEKSLEEAMVFAGPVGGTIEQGGAEKSGGKGKSAGAIGTLDMGASSGSDKTIAKEADEDDVMALISTPATAGDQEAAPPAKSPALESKPPATAYKSAAPTQPAPTAPPPAKPAPAPPAEAPDAAAGASQPTLSESKTATEGSWYPSSADGGEATKKKKGKASEAGKAEKSAAPAPQGVAAQDSVAKDEEAQAPADPFDQAMAEKKDKDWKGAIAILKTLKDNPSSTSAPQAKIYHELAICTAAAGSTSKALVIYENLFARFPDYAGRHQAMWEAAILYIESGDKAGAKALLAQLEKVPAWQKKAKKKLDKLD